MVGAFGHDPTTQTTRYFLAAAIEQTVLQEHPSLYRARLARSIAFDARMEHGQRLFVAPVGARRVQLGRKKRKRHLFNRYQRYRLQATPLLASVSIAITAACDGNRNTYPSDQHPYRPCFGHLDEPPRKA
jgi:hypothetical protein